MSDIKDRPPLSPKITDPNTGTPSGDAPLNTSGSGHPYGNLTPESSPSTPLHSYNIGAGKPGNSNPSDYEVVIAALRLKEQAMEKELTAQKELSEKYAELSKRLIHVINELGAIDLEARRLEEQEPKAKPVPSERKLKTLEEIQQMLQEARAEDIMPSEKDEKLAAVWEALAQKQKELNTAFQEIQEERERLDAQRKALEESCDSPSLKKVMEEAMSCPIPTDPNEILRGYRRTGW